MEKKLGMMRSYKKVIFIVILIIVALIITISAFKIIRNNDNDKIELNNNSALIEELGKKAEKDELDEVDSYYYWRFMEGNWIKLKENATREEREKIYNFHKNEKSALLELCKKNADWSLIPCNMEQFSFNQKDGLLGDWDYDTLKAIKSNSDDNAASILVSATKGNVDRVYRISYSWSDGTFNGIYVDLIEEKDLLTNEVKYDGVKVFSEENIKGNFEELCVDGEKRLMYPQEEWDGTYYGENVAVSENFREKYPYFLDIFIHYSPLEYNHIKLTDLDINNQVATFEVDSVLECKRRTYEVNYMLDNTMYLDDVNAELVSEKEYEIRPLGWKWFSGEVTPLYVLIYRNSNYNIILSTEKFKSTYNNNNRVLNIDVKNWDSYWNLYMITDQNDNRHFYYMKVLTVNNDDEIVDDIVFKELNYGNISFDEAKENYISEYGDRG